MDSRYMPKITIRLPQELKSWLAQQAQRNASSQSSEIVRAVRERMERTSGKKQQDIREQPAT
jgi:Arc/MetJ-type ribon-helix-helix transcriptional regulator